MRKLLKLLKNNDGATAIEFAMVAPALCWLMFGIIEFGILMATQSALEGATSKAARDYKALAREDTGGANAAAIHTRVANYASGLIMPGRLRVTARNVSWGASGGVESSPTTGGASGRTGDIIQYRAYYDYPVHTPFLSNVIGGSQGVLRLFASTVVQNEPHIEPAS